MEILVFKIMFTSFMILISTTMLIRLFDSDDFPNWLAVLIMLSFIFSALVLIVSTITYVWI